MRIDGARVLLTGGSRGIGRALAEGLLRAGARVVISGRNAETLDAVAEALRSQGEIVGVGGDVGADADAAAMVAAAAEGFGGLDLVVNNAAILTTPTPIVRTSPETWRAVLDANVVGTANVIRHALPVMEASGGGAIVNVSSTWGRSAASGVAPYCASKFAVEALTQSLAQELPAGIVTVAVNPGVINTEMLATAFQSDVSMYTSPEALVPAWLSLFEQLDASWNGRSVDL
ncbi:MAG: SDR family oxidoreductase [Planctomycetota bacterium]|nr:SDR family oxidoreductase [Planctomycetota bacterium]